VDYLFVNYSYMQLKVYFQYSVGAKQIISNTVLELHADKGKKKYLSMCKIVFRLFKHRFSRNFECEN